MKSAVPIERARAIIQGWFNEFCKYHGKPLVLLQIEEEGEGGTGAYRISNPSNGKTTRIFESTVSDYESSGSLGIPGELKSEIWDSFQDL